MEALSERERYENGNIPHDFIIPLSVIINAVNIYEENQ